VIRRVALSVLLASAVFLAAAPGAALAGPVLDRAVRCLETRPVCVDPAARRVLSAADARALGGDDGGGDF
jgi:hypothetical protein